MKKASTQMRFEDAGIFRDQIHAINQFKKQQRKVSADFEDRDIVALAKEEDFSIAVIVRIRNGRITSREKLSLRNLHEDDSKMMETVLTRFYLESDFIPNEITVQTEPSNQNQLVNWLKDKRNGSI